MNKVLLSDTQKARNYAFLLLKFRPRSEYEIRLRLKKKEYSEKVIREVVAFLREKKFVDDAAFASAWIESRLKKPFGFKRIRSELRTKGIESELCELKLQETAKQFPESSSVERLARQKFTQLKGLDPPKAKQRIFAFLLRRGFSAEVISDVISQLIVVKTVARPDLEKDESG